MPYLRFAVFLAVLGCLAAVAGWARDTPSSYGAPARVDTPVLRIGQCAKPPTIDGVKGPGEWEDASAASGFWYDFALSKFRFLAPQQTQLQVYAMYDKEHLYVAYDSPVYPENSWLKARGRFPDVISHPLYGVLWDDHVEFEIRPWPDLESGFRHGLFKFVVNVIGTTADQYWSIEQGQGKGWTSKTRIRGQADGQRWFLEFAIPLESLAYGTYAEEREDGTPRVKLPPPDGTIYRVWFTRAIGGNGKFFNAYDQHTWNTCKTQLILDSKAPTFQINELGPIMDDVIDLQLTVKNHNNRSETLLIGFFVESAEGLIYSSYNSPELQDGLLELLPGETRKLRLKQPFPGISRDGNVLWFDVRAAGRPAKSIFRTRLIRFHSMDGGEVVEHEQKISFRERRLDVIATLRPERKEFDLLWGFSPYTKRVSAIVDRGIHGASDEAQTATEAKLLVLKDDMDEDLVAEANFPFHGNFACKILDVPQLVSGESYKVSVLLFDKNKRIVGERSEEPFTFQVEEWQGNDLGQGDIVWEPFTPIAVDDRGFRTLKHRFDISPSGLPRQVSIRSDLRELPLELRAGMDRADPRQFQHLGRGPQLARPWRLELLAAGQRLPFAVREPAKLIRRDQSEIVYRSELTAGGVAATLETRYDCDGSMHCTLRYGAEEPVAIEGFEATAAFSGPYDMVVDGSAAGGGMAGSDRWDVRLPDTPGVVWHSAMNDGPELFYSRFVPWMFFGNGDRGWSWYSDSDEGWGLDKTSPSMFLERTPEGLVWRLKFVNRPETIAAERRIDFSVLVHPAKPKPKDYRRTSWLYLGTWAEGYDVEPIDLSEGYLRKRWRQASGAPADLPYEQAHTFRQDEPPFHRYGRWRNVGVSKEMDQIWEDKGVYYLERQVRVGRRVGWWWDEYWPVGFGRSNNLAMGNAYLRDPAEVGEDELPWQSKFLTGYMRNLQKRVAKIQTANNVPVRSHGWANNETLMLESVFYACMLVEECGSEHRGREIDIISQFPHHLWRFEAHNFTGLVARLVPGVPHARPGDGVMLDRTLLGRCLINDIGMLPSGPHGRFQNRQEALRIIRILHQFGYFQDQGTEWLAPWRNQDVLGFQVAGQGQEDVYVGAWRRALPDNAGYKALVVVINESPEDVEGTLRLKQAGRLLGGSNTLTTGAVMGATELSEELQGWWREQVAATWPQGTVAIADAESGEAIAGNGEPGAYGPIHLPTHGFRLFYLEHRP